MKTRRITLREDILWDIISTYVILEWRGTGAWSGLFEFTPRGIKTEARIPGTFTRCAR